MIRRLYIRTLKKLRAAQEDMYREWRAKTSTIIQVGASHDFPVLYRNFGVEAGWCLFVVGEEGNRMG